MKRSVTLLFLYRNCIGQKNANNVQSSKKNITMEKTLTEGNSGNCYD